MLWEETYQSKDFALSLLLEALKQIADKHGKHDNAGKRIDDNLEPASIATHAIFQIDMIADLIL